MALHKIITTSSLCMNCVHGGDCLFQQKATKPILRCELHRTAEPMAKASLDPSYMKPAPAALELCTTCDHRTYCALRGPERIVLHCDHFE